MLVRRADAGVVIGASLAAKPPGLGTGRSRSRWAGRRARFVGWPIRFAARAEEWRASFTGLAGLAQIPAAWVITSVVLTVFGWVPRLTAAVCGLLAVFIALGEFGVLCVTFSGKWHGFFSVMWRYRSGAWGRPFS